jgi:hypothetical protein
MAGGRIDTEEKNVSCLLATYVCVFFPGPVPTDNWRRLKAVCVPRGMIAYDVICGSVKVSGGWDGRDGMSSN